MAGLAAAPPACDSTYAAGFVATSARTRTLYRDNVTRSDLFAGGGARAGLIFYLMTSGVRPTRRAGGDTAALLGRTGTLMGVVALSACSLQQAASASRLVARRWHGNLASARTALDGARQNRKGGLLTAPRPRVSDDRMAGRWWRSRR
jgi:hypothetical protein